MPDTIPASRKPRGHVLILEADAGASRADCARPGAIADTGFAGLCLHPGTAVVTGDDVIAAEPVDLLNGSWGVHLTLSAAASARWRSQPHGSMVHEILNGKAIAELFPPVDPLVVSSGNGDEEVAGRLALALRPA
jgi:hypothetical protein